MRALGERPGALLARTGGDGLPDRPLARGTRTMGMCSSNEALLILYASP
jgi:hypothetical protein